MSIEEYLDILTGQLRCRKAREPVRRELLWHIQDQKEAFLAEGMEEKDAAEAAVREMGDPVEVGGALDRIHRPKMAWKLIGLIGILSIAGFMIQFFLRMHFLGEGADGSSGKQIVYLLLGFAVMAGVCFLDYSWFGSHARLLSAILLLGSFLGRKYLGANVNGSQKWIFLGGVSIDISLLLLLLVPLYGAILYSYRGEGYRAVAKGILWMAPGLFIVWHCPSVYAMMVLFFSYLIVLTAAIHRGWFQIRRRTVLWSLWGAVCLFPVIQGALILGRGGYQAERLMAVLSMDGGSNYQLDVVRRLLAGSHWIGAGSFVQTETAGLFAENLLGEYILTFVISYYGILAGLFLIGLILLLLVRLYHVSAKQKNQLGSMMGIGCVSVLMLQVIVYLLGNTGVFLMGTYCPFLTYGGSGIVVDFCLFGLVLSIYRYENVLAPDKVIRKKTSHVC
ncbi:MAG: FtsW/RodA/SpoVE family cell cycle protein [Lachnospiraceae bacterium]|nr:FtsW/RodA/SpoVE family cell cycle protein [Lachnospiraceae bacterium]